MIRLSDTECPVIRELCRDAGIDVPAHDPLKSLERMYRLADWAVRDITPRLMKEYDGVRDAFPIHAAALEGLHPIKSKETAQLAMTMLKQIAPVISMRRDGSFSPVLKQAHWLCLAAVECENGKAQPGAFGASGLFDLAESMGVSRDYALAQLIEAVL